MAADRHDHSTPSLPPGPHVGGCRHCWVVLALLLVSTPALHADELSFGEKERLAGTIIRMADGKVCFRSAAAGEVTAPWASVTDVRSTQRLAVQLADGRTLVGVLGGIEAGMLRVAGSTGVAAVKAAEVVHIGPETPPAANVAPQPPAIAKAQWLGSVELGLGILAGNSRRQDYRFGGEVRRRAPADRWHLALSVQHGQTRGQTDVSQGRMGLTYSHNLVGRHYYSTGAFLVHDDMRRLRVSGYYFLSRGYRLIDSPGNSSNLEVGGTYVNDNYRHEQRDDLTGLVRTVTAVRVPGNSTLRLVGMVWPSVNQARHVRGNAVLSLEVPVGKKLGLLFGLTEDYDSRPPEKTSRHDLQSTVSLTYRL